MGLMYIMPVDESEVDRVQITDGKIEVKSYGLPMVFWGYLIGIIATLLVMYVAIKNPIEKVLNSPDEINKFLGYLVLATIILIPVVLLFFYFYEKILSKKEETLTITHKFFFLPFYKKKIDLDKNEPFMVEHYLSSPNIAKMKDDPRFKGFENRGYHQLWAKNNSGQFVYLDRHSQRRELEKLANLLSKY